MPEHHGYMSADARRTMTAETVVELAGEQNPADITTATIARRMGLSHGAIFRHFASKEAIFESAMRWVSTRLLARLDAVAAAAASPAAALEAMFFAHVDFVVRHPGVPRMVFGELQRPGETLAKNVVQTMLGHYRARLRRSLAAGIARGEFAPELDVDVATTLFVGIIQGLVMQTMLVADPERIRAAAPHAFAIYRRGIEARS